MDKQEKAKQFLNRFFAAHPRPFFKSIDGSIRGMHPILRYVDSATTEVLAGDIAEFMGVSTPRVAAVLNCMEQKGFVVRHPSASDRRKVVVSITDGGKAELKKAGDEMLKFAEYLYDTVGDDDLNEFLRISERISQALQNRLEEVK
ncbi:MAG: MarR family winged helix-turn-helix transcriptional regulator [Clostridiales bacterium]|nr:MarR family winged helix-turn-helix transcriptional regulator [Clostridiales bacterium]